MNARRSGLRHNGARGLWTVTGGALVLFLLALALNLPRRESSFSKPVVKSKLQNRPAANRSLAPAIQRISTPNAVDGEDSSDQTREDAWMSISPARRGALMSPEAMTPYETILSSLHLSPRGLRRVKELIVERAESASDAEDLGRETHLNPEETSAVRVEAETFFDRQFEEVAGSANARVIRHMLALTPQLEELTRAMNSDMAGDHVPLTAEQALQLAQFYKDEFTVTVQGVPVDRSAGYDDQTGLAEADRRILAKASGLLNPAQVDRLRSRMSSVAMVSVDAVR